jgi:hypothetical protein
MGNLDHLGKILIRSAQTGTTKSKPDRINMRRRVFSIFLVLTAMVSAMLVSCSQPGSGISGITTVDAGCPALPADETCAEKPLQARVSVLDSSGRKAGETTSNERGEFRLHLPAGDYQLLATNVSGRPLPSALPISVTVRPDEFTTVTVKFDSGVR